METCSHSVTSYKCTGPALPACPSAACGCRGCGPAQGAVHRPGTERSCRPHPAHTLSPTPRCPPCAVQIHGGFLGRLWVQPSRPALPCSRHWPDTAGIAAVLALPPTSPGPIALALCLLARGVPGPPSCPVERGRVPCMLSEPARAFCPVGSRQHSAAEREAGADRRHKDRDCQVTVAGGQCWVTPGPLPFPQHQRGPRERGGPGRGCKPQSPALPCCFASEHP